MLPFEHKQYLQSYDTESSMQTEILSFQMYDSLMPIDTAQRDYKELLSKGLRMETSHWLNSVQCMKWKHLC